MASFKILADAENNSNVLRPKMKEPGNNQRRVLGLVNSNVDALKNAKNIVQEKGAIKPKLANRTNIQAEQLKLNAKSNKVTSVKMTCQPFQVFEDDDESTKPVALKQDSKSRVLRDKMCNPVSSCDNQPLLTKKHSLMVAKTLPVPEPMSPESEDSPMCLDASMRSEGKSEEKGVHQLVSECAEAATRALDYLKLTDRLYMCEEYRDEISLYLRTLQHEHRPRKNYMARQPDITYNMRAVLVDWLVEVVEEYKMTNETLYLAVSYIDRFLSSMSVIRSKLQLVGTAAMFIAAKYEEIYPPDVKDFVYITDDTYTKKQVLRMEHLILRILHFDLSVPTPLNFLSDYTSHHPTPDNVKYLAMYLCELSLMQGDPYLSFLPSEIAAAALCVARASLLPDEDVIPPALHSIMDVQLADIIHVIGALEGTYRYAESNAQQATRDKFKSDKYLGVSLLPPPETECSSLLTRSTPTPERHQSRT